MRIEPAAAHRALKRRSLQTDLCVVGGGLAGVCAAITAARTGIRVVLIQDRPVLGGNASSEVRLWTLGATSHMGNNNRWAREGGLINELLTENLYRNPEGNALLVDALLFEKASAEPNLTLLLNTAVFDAQKRDPGSIAAVTAFNSQNSTLHEVSAPLFLDASGDGILGFLAGAAFRIGQEARAEFGELYAPVEASAELLGHTVYFTSKDTGHPVKFIPPANALDMETVRRIRRYRGFDSKSQACNFWWLEYGGHLDTIHQSEEIKQELWRVVYGVWNFIKNSGEFPEAATMTLEWIGTVPGKRESRRFEGDYMLVQQDLIEQRVHPDAVSFGGWAIDHHPVEGLYSEKSGCTQWHSKGIFQIPYRCLYSRNIENLFLGGRVISVSHIAFGSTRVMATCAHSGQATGMAAAHCVRKQLLPRHLLQPRNMRELQQDLLRGNHYIPGVPYEGKGNLVRQARLSVSSTCVLDELSPCGIAARLDFALALMLPVRAGQLSQITFLINVASPSTLRAEIRISSKRENHTPDITLEARELSLPAGDAQQVPLAFAASIPHDCYAFVCLMANPALAVHLSEERRTGILTLHQKHEKAVAKTAAQVPPGDSGIERFEFWIPQRRPGGRNPAIRLDPPIACFGKDQVCNGWARPIAQSNAWVADPRDPNPSVILEWDSPRTIRRIEVLFDGDYDHPMETVLWGHPERVVPSCVRRLRIVSEGQRVVADVTENHQAHLAIRLPEALETQRLEFVDLRTDGTYPPAIFEVRCYSNP